ncbi:MAG: hypothetical protein AB7S41_20245 [Parvibaculaceae bacterium]
MSQIEMVMSAALGFAFAGLIALLVGRFVWSYSNRIGRRRTERSGSGAMAEMQADRDRLKVENAMLTRRFEMRVDDLKTRLAEQMADASRYRNRIDQLAADLGSRTELLTRRELEIAQFREQVAPLESELATRTQALQQIKAQLRDRDEEGAREPEILAPAQHAVLPPFDAGELSGLSPEAQSDPVLQDRVSSRIAELSSLARQIETQRQELLREQAELIAIKDGMTRPRKRRRRKGEDGPAAPQRPAVVRKSRARAEPAATEAAAPQDVSFPEVLPEPQSPVPQALPILVNTEGVASTEAVAVADTSGDPELPLQMPVKAVVEAAVSSAETPEPATPAEPADATTEEGEGATVITLASRIRALQRGAQG